MRIGIDAYPLSSIPGSGIGTYLYNLFSNLEPLDRENEYFIYGHSGIILPFNNNRWHMRVIKIPNFAQKSCTFWLLQDWVKILRRDNIDVFLGSQNCLPLFLPRKIKRILVVNDLALFSCPQTFEVSTDLFLIIPRIIFMRSLSVVDKIITISNATKNDLMKTFPNFEENKIDLIYDAVQTDFFRPSNQVEVREYIRKNFFISGNYILTVTALEWRKNVTGLLKAFHLFKNKFKTGHKLLIAGGEERSKVNQIYGISKDLSLDRDVCFLGTIDFEDLVRLYQGADEFIFLSLFEGFGLPPLEAMSCGIPVVASDIPVFREVLGDAALLVNPHNIEEIADAVYNVLDDCALREKLITKGLERVRQFSWAETAKKTLEVITNIGCQA